MRDRDPFGEGSFERAMREERHAAYGRMARKDAERRRFECGDIDGIVRTGDRNIARQDWSTSSKLRLMGSPDKGIFN